MNAEHRQRCSDRWDDDLAAYSLDALEADEAVAVERHVADCSRCAERLEWLRPAVDLIPQSVQQHPAPDQLRQALMAAVHAEAEAAEAAPSRRAAAPSSGSLGARVRSWFRVPQLSPALAGLATLAVVIAGVGGYLLRDDEGPEARTIAAASLVPEAGADGQLEIYGDTGVLRLTGLPLLSRDEVYQAWIRPEPGAEPQPSSVFVAGNGEQTVAAIPEGLSGASEVLVTVEPRPGSKEPTTTPFVSAPLN